MFFIISLLAFADLPPLTAQETSGAVPSRIVMGGRAVAMVAHVVYAFPAIRDSVVAVGGTDQGLGTFLEAIAPGFAEKPNLDRNAGAEDYAALQPDLLILKSAMRGRIGGALERLGLASLYLDLESPADYYRDLAALGQIFRAEARAAELIDYYQAIVARAASLATADSQRPRVLVVQMNETGLQIPPDGWIQTQMVELAGALPVWKGSNPTGGWAALNAEQLAAWNPDFIALISYDRPINQVIAAFRNNNRYYRLQAVRANQVIGFPQDFYSWDQPDPRWGLGLLWLAKSLHPSAAAGLELTTEARRFFRLFYNMDDAAFDRHIQPRLVGL
ncbi:MAG: hypothetical protein A2087_13485 [Spirochaetes bacterium GWD1_61_31]|nr:MAG: hypothetical protein A2087_13485 [Spirochaetes bacterium GWD1_61_31]OHD45554.1 MAG: hypothetical protein A2Y35_03160 [Spirochaetes bacterium GWE1_60_18]